MEKISDERIWAVSDGEAEFTNDELRSVIHEMGKARTHRFIATGLRIQRLQEKAQPNPKRIGHLPSGV